MAKDGAGVGVRVTGRVGRAVAVALAIAGGCWSADAIPVAPSRTPASVAAENDPALAELQDRVRAVARASRAHVGLAAIDLGTGRMVSVNGAEHFPMASTVKVAIAATFLKGVQDGRLSLDAGYTMPSRERARAARLGDMRRLRRGLTGAQLIDLMLTRSDNSAADVLLAAVGGTAAVSRWLDHAGVTGQRVDRSIAELLTDSQSYRRVRAGHGRRRHWITVAVPRRAAAGDRRDTSTPEAMAALLVKLRDGKLLDETRTSYLFDVMSRCRTGPNRIRGLLPPGTPVAHKTGTMNGITDDVGIINLPNGHQLAIAVFEQGPGGVAAHDRNIARLARMLYDGFGNDTRMAGGAGAAGAAQ